VSDTSGVHNGRVSLSMTSERGRAPVYRLMRFILLALVAAGVIGMHVLSQQNTGTGHGMVMDAAPPAAALAQSASVIDHQAMDMTPSSAAPRVSPAVASSANLMAPVHPGLPGAMAMCLLFLATGAAALTLTLLAVQAGRRTADLTVRFSGIWGASRRGPPLSPVDPDFLCILRV
jgi:hypothetical protein